MSSGGRGATADATSSDIGLAQLQHWLMPTVHGSSIEAFCCATDRTPKRRHHSILQLLHGGSTMNNDTTELRLTRRVARVLQGLLEQRYTCDPGCSGLEPITSFKYTHGLYMDLCDQWDGCRIAGHPPVPANQHVVREDRNLTRLFSCTTCRNRHFVGLHKPPTPGSDAPVFRPEPLLP